MAIGPLRHILLRRRLNESYETHPEHAEQITLLLEDKTAFNSWLDAIANANRRLVSMDWDEFFAFIRDNWLDLLLLGVRIALLFAKTNKGER